MDDPRRLKFQPYVRLLADKMRLKDWEVEISSVQPSQDADASIKCVFGRKLAVIRLSDTFLESKPEEQRHTIIHELTHCHYAACNEIAENKLPCDAYGAWQMDWEYGIDATADMLAPFMPLPPKDKRKK